VLHQEGKIMESRLLGVRSRRSTTSTWAEFCIWRAT